MQLNNHNELNALAEYIFENKEKIPDQNFKELLEMIGEIKKKENDYYTVTVLYPTYYYINEDDEDGEEELRVSIYNESFLINKNISTNQNSIYEKELINNIVDKIVDNSTDTIFVHSWVFKKMLIFEKDSRRNFGDTVYFTNCKKFG